jgi:hypothetical protein
MTMSRNCGCFLLAIVAIVGIIIPATAQTPREDRIAISPERVASAMAEAGWKVSPGQVKLLSQLSFAARDTWLQVVRVTHWQENTLKVELRCHDPRACLPFYVLINQGGTADKPGQTLSTDSESHPGQRHSELETTVEKPLMRSGDPATLTFRDRGLSITMPVICLQSGSQGQMIRVASADHKRFYKAEIVGPGLLKATAL